MVRRREGRWKSKSFSMNHPCRCCSSRADRPSSDCGQCIGTPTVLIRSVETSPSQSGRWSSLVFDLCSSNLRSIHPCSTVYIVFRSSLSLDVPEHHLLRSLRWESNEQWHKQHHHSRICSNLTSTGLFISLSLFYDCQRSSSVSLWNCWPPYRVYWSCNSFAVFVFFSEELAVVVVVSHLWSLFDLDDPLDLLHRCSWHRIRWFQSSTMVDIDSQRILLVGSSHSTTQSILSTHNTWNNFIFFRIGFMLDRFRLILRLRCQEWSRKSRLGSSWRTLSSSIWRLCFPRERCAETFFFTL